jgi:hypothetical protein
MAEADPASYLTLEPGADVFDSSGERVGMVEHVLRDEASDIFDGLVIDISLGPGGHRFVDAPDVGEMREGAVSLKLTAEQVDALPAPAPGPGVMEHHGAEDSESPLAGKLRRAWELVSGKGPS